MNFKTEFVRRVLKISSWKEVSSQNHLGPIRNHYKETPPTGLHRHNQAPGEAPARPRVQEDLAWSEVGAKGKPQGPSERRPEQYQGPGHGHEERGPCVHVGEADPKVRGVG